MGKLIEGGHFKDAMNEIFEFVRNANKFFDAEQPWITRNTDKIASGYLLPEVEILFQVKLSELFGERMGLIQFDKIPIYIDEEN